MLTTKQFIYALRDGITTIDLVNRTGDPKAVIRAFQLGVQADRLKQVDGMYRAVLKFPYDRPCAVCGTDLYPRSRYIYEDEDDEPIISFYDDEKDEVCEKCHIKNGDNHEKI